MQKSKKPRWFRFNWNHRGFIGFGKDRLTKKETAFRLSLWCAGQKYTCKPLPTRGKSCKYGLSHGLKKCPPDTFLPSLRSGRPFKSRIPNKKDIHSDVLFIWCARRDLKPGYVNRFGKYIVVIKGYSPPFGRPFADVVSQNRLCKPCYLNCLRQMQRPGIQSSLPLLLQRTAAHGCKYS